jgi:hypothetical protein
MVALIVCVAIFVGAVVLLFVERARHIKALSAVATPPEPIYYPLAVSLLSLILVTGPCMSFIAAVPPVPTLFGDLACSPGWTLDPNVSSSSSRIGGTGFAGVCAEGPRPSWLAHHMEVSWLFRFACFSYLAAITASVGLVLMFRKARRVRKEMAA